MTSPEILTRVLFLLDDEDADYWTEDDVYKAINAAQLEIFKRALAVFIAKKGGKLLDILRPFYKETSVVSASKKNTFPAGLEHLLGAKYEHNVSSFSGDEVPVIIQEQDDNFYIDRDNPYFSGGDENPIGWMSTQDNGDSCLEIETTDSNYGMIQLVYLRKPNTITSSVDPDLRDIVHDSLVQYTYSSMLLKDDQFQGSALEMKKFDTMFAGVIQ